MEQMKRLPYGISDFRQVMREGKYYVDKTMFLPVMEETDHFLFLVRPRRFGKSIFLSMLRAYYDINERENFQELFYGLWIADHPTPQLHPGAEVREGRRHRGRRRQPVAGGCGADTPVCPRQPCQLFCRQHPPPPAHHAGQGLRDHQDGGDSQQINYPKRIIHLG